VHHVSRSIVTLDYDVNTTIRSSPTIVMQAQAFSSACHLSIPPLPSFANKIPWSSQQHHNVYPRITMASAQENSELGAFKDVVFRGRSAEAQAQAQQPSDQKAASNGPSPHQSGVPLRTRKVPFPELREAGISLNTGSHSSDDENGYLELPVDVLREWLFEEGSSAREKIWKWLEGVEDHGELEMQEGLPHYGQEDVMCEIPLGEGGEDGVWKRTVRKLK
jgi:hypothetical protein